MMLVLDTLLFTVALGVLLLALVLFVECSLAILPRNLGFRSSSADRPSLAVLIPAHNEEGSIAKAVRSIAPQLGPKDRLVVIADHCTDGTVEIAREAGAVVIERGAPLPSGKAHALNQGLDSLAADPPEVVVMIDADCVAFPGTVERIAGLARACGRPAQSRNVVEPPPSSDLVGRLSAFAFMVRNVVRPSGLAYIGLPCHLMGTGMALPWRIGREVSLAGGHLVEDLKLGIDLALAGYPPIYCHDAVVSSPLPARPEAARMQRRRWEHGHLQTLIIDVPRLLRGAIRQQRWDLLAMALDLAIPPLSLLMLLAVGGLVVCVVGGGLGASWVPAALLSAAVMLMLTGIYAAWFKFGRAFFPMKVLLVAPGYVLGKIPLYGAFLFARQRSWERGAKHDADL